MKQKLKEELVKLSTDIINSDGVDEVPRLYEAAKNLYEKLAILKFIEEKLSDIEIDVSKNIIAAKFEKMANSVMNENKEVPENNPHEEDIITPGIDTIKGMVSEMPSSEEVEKIFAEFVAKAEVIKNDKNWVTPGPEVEKKEVQPKSLNDKFSGKQISVGLNDRLAFVKHLFNGSSESFDQVLAELNTIESEERSQAFIENMVKPEYANWEGKQEFEKRFMALVKRRFLS